MSNKSEYAKTIIGPGDTISEMAAKVCRGSYRNNEAVTVHELTDQKGFRAPVAWRWSKKVLELILEGKILQITQDDGAGSKPQFFTISDDPSHWKNLAWEIITMNADDIACKGGLPVVFSNILDIKNADEKKLQSIRLLFEGLDIALKESNLVNITGETAILPNQVTAFDSRYFITDEQLVLNWNASCTGLLHVDRLITGGKITPGMEIIGLHEEGYRCNGGTHFANLIFSLKRLGSAEEKIKRLNDQLIIPSKSYARFLSWANGWNKDGSTRTKARLNVLGAAHITGGGVFGKLPEILPDGIGAKLMDMPKPPKALLLGYEMGKEHGSISQWQCYQTFHGGCGMLLVTHPKEADLICTTAKSLFGITATIVGKTISSQEKEIIILSKFGKRRKILSSLNPE